MTKVLADTLVPIFAGLLLGYFAGLWRREWTIKTCELSSPFVMSLPSLVRCSSRSRVHFADGIA